jgi:hypothetical protein
MGAHRSKGQEKGRTSKMYDTNRGGLDRHSDNGWSKVATEKTPPTARSTRKFLALVRRAL